MREQIFEASARFRSGELSSRGLAERLVTLVGQDPEALALARSVVEALTGERLLSSEAAGQITRRLSQPADATLANVDKYVNPANDDRTVAAGQARDRTALKPVTADATVMRPKRQRSNTQSAATDKTIPENAASTVVGPAGSARKSGRTGSRPTGPTGPTGPSGPTGPTGPTGGSNWANPAAWQPTHDGPVRPGLVLKDRYVVESQLGAGGMGAVFKVRDLVHEAAGDKEPYVAMKVLHGDFQRHPDALKALFSETKKSTKLAHPNIITVHLFDHDGTTVFMTMELLDGTPLDKVINAHKLTGLPAAQAADIILQLGTALAYAHERGFVHADFKPGNSFLCEDGRVKVLDFGIAQRVRVVSASAGATAGDNTLFDPHHLGGLTVAYASAEMHERERPEPADDVYALGIVAYQLYSGRHPFEGTAANKARDAGMTPKPLKGVPRRQMRSIERALKFTRAERFAHAGDFLKAFRGPRPLQRWAAVGLLLLTVVSAGLGVRQIWFSDNVVAFDELPADTRQQILALEAPAEEAFEMAPDMAAYRNEAMDYYQRILALHPDNRNALDRVDALGRQWLGELRALTDNGDKDRAVRLVSDVFSAYPVLRGHADLAREARDLGMQVQCGNGKAPVLGVC